MGDEVLFYRFKDVLRKVGLCETRLRELIRAGSFPKPIQIVPGEKGRAVAFIAQEVEDFMRARIAARDKNEGAMNRANTIQRAVEARQRQRATARANQRKQYAASAA